MIVSEQPNAELIIRLTLCVPAVVKVCEGEFEFDVYESLKFQAVDAIEPVVILEVFVKDVALPKHVAGVLKDATGFGCIVMLPFTFALQPPAVVTCKLTT